MDKFRRYEAALKVEGNARTKETRKLVRELFPGMDIEVMRLNSYPDSHTIHISWKQSLGLDSKIVATKLLRRGFNVKAEKSHADQGLNRNWTRQRVMVEFPTTVTA